MRINFYEARLSEDDRIILVKDIAVNYKAEKLNATLITPRDEDIEVTNRIKKVGDLLEVKLVDHIIIAGDSYYSFKEDEMI